MTGNAPQKFEDQRPESDARAASEASLVETGTLGGQATVGGTGSKSTADESTDVVDLSTRYEVVEVIGRGGMGEVLLAKDRRLGRQVAIKRIRKELLGEGAVRRFLAEARALAALNHPNIVQLYDCGQDQKGPFLILEYVGGATLRHLCSSGPVDAAKSIKIVALVCDGLERAHALGIIHRDIKPANILMTTGGVPKLTDFGIAKVSADRGQSLSGQVLGTPDFMPPEQRTAGSDVDERADQWSLAATLYQMLTGEPPGVINLEAVPRAVRPVLARALKSRKEDRFKNIREFRAELRRSVRPQTAAAPGPPPRGAAPRSDSQPEAGTPASPPAFDFDAVSQSLETLQSAALVAKERELAELVNAMKARNPPEVHRVRAVVKAAKAYLKINPKNGGIQKLLETVSRSWPGAAGRLTLDDLKRLLGDFGNSRLYVAPNIPAVLLENAVASFMKDVGPQDVLLLHDITTFGGAREGVALTAEAIYWKKDKFSPPEWCRYQDITSLKRLSTWFSGLRLNGKYVAATYFVNKPLFSVVSSVSDISAED